MDKRKGNLMVFHVEGERSVVGHVGLQIRPSIESEESHGNTFSAGRCCVTEDLIYN